MSLIINGIDQWGDNPVRPPSGALPEPMLQRFLIQARNHGKEIERLKAEKAAVAEIVERIMTQHWDMAACPCWVCVAGRDAGCRPMRQYLQRDRPRVRVDATLDDRYRVDL